MPKNILLLVPTAIIVMALYYHLQNPLLVIGGFLATIAVHLALFGGAAHIIPALKKRFHGEPVEHNSPNDGV